MSESTLTGKKALVAGGASGIGAAAVRALAQRGAHVIVADIDPADFHRILTLMLESPFLLIRAVLPHMYEREWGRIINVSSVHGLPASAFKSAYVAAKHGVEGLSKAVALEGAPHGVTSNCVNPSYVRTPLVDKRIKDQVATHGIPEEEVVKKIMLTGAAYTMDGGWTAS